MHVTHVNHYGTALVSHPKTGQMVPLDDPSLPPEFAARAKAFNDRLSLRLYRAMQEVKD